MFRQQLLILWGLSIIIDHQLQKNDMIKFIFSLVALAVCTLGLSAQSSVQSALDKKDYRSVQKMGKEVNQAFETEGMTITPLSYAALKGDAEMVSLLLKKGASASQTAGGFDALMHAARGGNSECVDLILAAGVKVTNESKDGLTARDYAVQAGHTDIAVKLDKLMNAEIEKMRAARKK